jgi:hypothetical protein
VATVEKTHFCGSLYMQTFIGFDGTLYGMEELGSTSYTIVPPTQL